MCLSIPFSWLKVEGMNYNHTLALAITLTKYHRIMESFRLETAFVLDHLEHFHNGEAPSISAHRDQLGWTVQTHNKHLK